MNISMLSRVNEIITFSHPITCVQYPLFSYFGAVSQGMSRDMNTWWAKRGGETSGRQPPSNKNGDTKCVCLFGHTGAYMCGMTFCGTEHLSHRLKEG